MILYPNNLNISLYPVKDTIFLKISLISEDTSIIKDSPVPFLIISDSDPLLKLIEGRIVNGSGDEVKSVYIMVQRDNYLLSGEEKWPKNNREIDSAWQYMYTSYYSKKGRDLFHTFPEQINKTGDLAPVPPLLFCKKTRAFFHPPCPECGAALELCYYDPLLTSMGLKAYKDSLERYLFCPSCFAQRGVSNFYANTKAEGLPEIVKGLSYLVGSFGAMIQRGTGGKGFPCIDCVSKAECYEGAGSASSRIVPFSFYPFYMFTFGAMSVKAADFLKIISGARVGETVSRHSEGEGPQGARYLEKLKGEDILSRRKGGGFLELLYIKLSLLYEILLEIFSQKDLGKKWIPGISASLDRIWVRIVDHTISILPPIDFSVCILDIMRDYSAEYSALQLPKTSSLNLLGPLWFYTLVSNRYQDMGRILDMLESAYAQGNTIAGASFENILKDETFAGFSPSNALWDPAQYPSDGSFIDAVCYALWEKSLCLGWSLFNNPEGEDPKRGEEDFLKRFETLLEEVKGNLAGQRLYAPGQVGIDRLEITPQEADRRQSPIQQADRQEHALRQADSQIHATKQADRLDPAKRHVDVVKSARQQGGLLETDPVYAIIMNIIRRLQKEIVTGEGGPDRTKAFPGGVISRKSTDTQGVEEGKERELDETIMISPGSLQRPYTQDKGEIEKGSGGSGSKKLADSLDDTAPVQEDVFDEKGVSHVSTDEESEVDLDKTIIADASASGVKPTGDLPITDETQESLDKTIITSQGEGPAPFFRGENKPGEDLEATIIRPAADSEKAASPFTERAVDKARDNVAGAEGAGEKGEEEQDEAIPEDLFSTETIILSADELEKKKDKENE